MKIHYIWPIPLLFNICCYTSARSTPQFTYTFYYWMLLSHLKFEPIIKDAVLKNNTHVDTYKHTNCWLEMSFKGSSGTVLLSEAMQGRQGRNLKKWSLELGSLQECPWRRLADFGRFSHLVLNLRKAGKKQYKILCVVHLGAGWQALPKRVQREKISYNRWKRTPTHPRLEKQTDQRIPLRSSVVSQCVC